MKNFLRGGRGLPVGQGYVCSIQQNRLRHYVRNDVSRVIIIFCVLFSSLVFTQAVAQGSRGMSRIDFGDKLGTEGLNKIKPLRVGDVVPDDFWTYEHLFYVDGDTIRITLEEYKGKLLVLDFWMIGCSKCFIHQKEINYFKTLYSDSLAVVLVNGLKTGNRYNDIHKALDAPWVRSLGLEKFSSIIESDYLDSLFAPAGYPGYYWINRFGILQTCTMRNLLDRKYGAPFLDKN